MQDLYPSFAKGLAPFFTLQWGEYSDFLTFNGGSVFFGPLEILLSLLILSTWRKPKKFGNSIPFATKIQLPQKFKKKVFLMASPQQNADGSADEQSIKPYVPLQSSILSNPKFFGSNEQYVIIDFDGVERVLQLPKTFSTMEETLPQNKKDLLQNSDQKSDLPSIWFLYNHKVWNSYHEDCENYNTWQKLKNMPGIYEIECKKTGKKYIGETQNIRERFRSTYNTLQKGKHASPSLQSDWKSVGPQNFVFTILYMDRRLAENELRKNIEAFLVYENNTNVYNERKTYGLTRSKDSFLEKIEKTRVFLQEFPQVNTILGWFDAGMTISKKQLGDVLTKFDQPGIYVILSLQTKKVYIGESQSLRRRFTETRKRFSSGKYSCKELASDVQKYGIHSFCFIPLHYGPEWEDQNVRFKVEKKCITLNRSIVYNTQHSGKTKQKPNPQFKDRFNSEKTKQKPNPQ
jgi:predicted GIY-YIG superfamily endonuclease